MVYRLTMDFNPLDFNRGEAFLYSETLEVFTCRHCNISYVFNDTFTEVPNITEIDLSYNQITIIEARAFYKNIHLKKLALNGNQLKTIPSTVFVTLRYFITLELNENYDFQFDNKNPLNSESLEHLYCCSCGNKHINMTTFIYLPKLRELSLKNNKITSIHKYSFWFNHHIEGFNLNGNFLEDNYRLYSPKLRNARIIDCFD